MQEYITVGKRLTISLPDKKIVITPSNYNDKTHIKPDIDTG
jgi:hypothetical protein